MSTLSPFHLAIPVDDIPTNRKFYGEVLGCSEGRSSDHWVDFDFFGHQLVIHLAPKAEEDPHANPVDGKQVPVPHFGVVLNMEEFDSLADRLKKLGTEFIIEPYTRFKGEVGEQSTMFFADPAGNALEFKAFRNIDQLFAK
jgi:extradiol dioxygenase family protein